MKKLSPDSANKIKAVCIFTGLADSITTLVKHRDKVARELKRRGANEEAAIVKSWDSQELLDFRIEYGI